MNKTKMMLAVVGGVAGVLLLAAAFLVWRASAAKTAAREGDYEENVEGLETVLDGARSLARKEIYPSAESVRAIVSNRTLVAGWAKEARQLAARGDKRLEPTTPPAFKAFIVGDAKRLQELPGAVEGRIAAAAFGFGPFKPYVAEGKMPEPGELADLQRRWDDVAGVVEILSACGVAELKDVAFANVAVEEPEPKSPKARKRARAAAKQPAPEVAGPQAFTYQFTFTAKPVAFVKAINALENAERFTVVDDFTFTRSRDAVAQALGGGDEGRLGAKSGAAARRARGRAAEAAKDAAKQAGGVVTDPQTDEPLVVTLTVTVHDFRTMEAEKGEEVAK